MKILLIEDDESTGSALTDILTAQHYTVNQATDGQTGLELAREFEYDLIMLDVVLPKLDGISMCRRLRTEGYQYPILLLTAKLGTECVKVITLDGVVQTINPAGLSIIESNSIEQALGQPIFPLIDPAYRPAFIEFK